MTGVLVHATALVESDRLGQAPAHVLAGAVVGVNCNSGDHCFVESKAVVGDDVTIKNGNAIWDGVTLEDGVLVGPASFARAWQSRWAGRVGVPLRPAAPFR